MRLWHGEPLILASASEVRRSLLEAAAVPVIVDPAEIDERAVEATAAPGGAPDAVARMLAHEKALAVARRRSGIVLGADQTLALDGRRFSKPASLCAARDQLAALAGRTHELHSAVAIARGDEILFETVATSRLSMRLLSAEFLDAYLAEAGDVVHRSVGGYQLERLGVHLFERIEGDHFTILGLPLLPLLAYFRRAGFLS